MEDRLRQFLADAIEKAGGSKSLAYELSQLGFRGRDGKGVLVDATVRAWRRGDHAPAPEVVFAIANHYGLSLDAYARGHDAQAELRAELDHLRSRQGVLTDWLLEVGVATGLNFHERVSQLDRTERLGA